MSSYLVVKNSTNTLSYPCKTTHTGNPYLKVDTGYLDLTTETTTGTYVVVKSGESNYRPKNLLLVRKKLVMIIINILFYYLTVNMLMLLKLLLIQTVYMDKHKIMQLE